MTECPSFSLSKVVLCALLASGLPAFPGTGTADAQGSHWAVQPGEQIEVLRDYVCFEEGRAGERKTARTVTFYKPVLSAEVFLSGFNIWYTRGGDSEVRQHRVDAWVDAINVAPNYPPGTRGPGLPDPKSVRLSFIYALTDEDTGGGEDFNDACIGFTVIARTK
jgi:hypothetical protein